jgi:ABC-2 type transport system permease protein
MAQTSAAPTDALGGSQPVVPASPDQPELEATLVAPHRSVRQHLALIWQYRELLHGLVRKELKVRYKGSALGFAWSMLNPATSLAVYYLVFAVFLKSPIPYFAFFLLSGQLAWNLFTASIPAATASIVGNAPLIKKVYFPREVLPLATIGAAMVHFVLQSIVLLAALAVFRYDIDWGYLWLVLPAIVTLLLFTAALGIFLSAVNVYMRDLQHLMEIALMMWFWVTPILYQYTLISDRLASHGLSWTIRLNPLTSIVLAMQRGIWGRAYGDLDPDTGIRPLIIPDASQWWYLSNLLLVAAASIVLIVGAIKVFDHLEGNFSEEI